MSDQMFCFIDVVLFVFLSSLLISLVAKRGPRAPLDKLTGPTFSDLEFYVENEFWCRQKIYSGGGGFSGAF